MIKNNMDLGYQKIDKYDEACVAEMAEHYKAIIKLLGRILSVRDF